MSETKVAKSRVSKVSECLKRTLLTTGYYFSFEISSDWRWRCTFAEEEETAFFSPAMKATTTGRRHAPRRPNNESETGELQLSSTTCRVQRTRATIYVRKQTPRSQSVTLDRHIIPKLISDSTFFLKSSLCPYHRRYLFGLLEIT